MPLIAHLTDLHIREGGALAYGRVDTLGFLRAAIAHLNSLAPRPDAVVVTGDLGDVGTADEYVLVRAELDSLAMPYHAIPGNHDGPAFWQAFADLMPDAVENVGHIAEVGSVRIVLLDTRVDGASHGEIDEARTAWLAEALPSSDPTLLALHHPPIRTGIGHMDRIGLLGTERLAAIVAKAPPLAILCGHIHRTIQGRLEGVPVIVAPSPAHAVTLDLTEHGPSTFQMDPPGILLHRVGQDGLLTHLSFIGDYPGPFSFAGPDAD